MYTYLTQIILELSELEGIENESQCDEKTGIENES